MTSVTVEGRGRAAHQRGRAGPRLRQHLPAPGRAAGEGDFDGETLICARHLWEFDADTGCGINPDNARLTVFGCKVGDDSMIWVDIGR